MKKYFQHSSQTSVYRDRGAKYLIFLSTLLICLLFSSNSALALSGDLDGDGDVDRNDLSILLADRNKSVGDSSCGTPCDLDGDGIISALDARKLVLLCTLPRCAIVQANQPPVANAGDDGTTALPEGQTSIDIQLDGSSSSDLDGTVVNYTWTGTPDPEDVAGPTVTLSQGIYNFSLIVTDNDGAVSTSDDVVIAVLGIPELITLPTVTTQSTIVVSGRTVPGVKVIIRGGVQEASGDSLPDEGFFKVPVQLNMGENHLRIVAEYRGVESNPADADITRASTTLTLAGINPDTGQAGSILDLTGSGFTPDKAVMGVYFKGTEQEGAGLVLEATETTMKVVVPFVFLNTDEEIQVYVYSI